MSCIMYSWSLNLGYFINVQWISNARKTFSIWLTVVQLVRMMQLEVNKKLVPGHDKWTLAVWSHELPCVPTRKKKHYKKYESLNKTKIRIVTTTAILIN